ncbi:hypothetical protein Sjap_008619 [Stephania japonica]|uniref:Phytocyanin domain-containing protein n=1 Tax=Stephania japonica TaxID=461633 RepID=A0AAP0PES9_9MAGN
MRRGWCSAASGQMENARWLGSIVSRITKEDRVGLTQPEYKVVSRTTREDRVDRTTNETESTERLTEQKGRTPPSHAYKVLKDIRKDVETKGNLIRSLFEIIRAAVFTDIEDVLYLVNWLDNELSSSQHDVVEVMKEAFDSCSVNNTISLHLNGPARIKLNNTGNHYFICTFNGHCSAGQKLAISVKPDEDAVSPSRSVVPPLTRRSAQPPTSNPGSRRRRVVSLSVCSQNECFISGSLDRTVLLWDQRAEKSQVSHGSSARKALVREAKLCDVDVDVVVAGISRPNGIGRCGGPKFPGRPVDLVSPASALETTATYMQPALKGIKRWHSNMQSKQIFSRICEEIRERSEVGENDLRLGGDDSGRLTLKLRPSHSVFPTAPVVVSVVKDLYDFICSRPLIDKLGVTPETVATNINGVLDTKKMVRVLYMPSS